MPLVTQKATPNLELLIDKLIKTLVFQLKD